MAATLTFGEGTKHSHSAAAELYGWVRFPLKDLHVTTLTKREARDGITPHHRSNGVAYRVVDHIPVTGPEQTILDCASTIESDRLYRRIVRQAQIDHTTHARLVAFSAVNRGKRGVARLRRGLEEGPSPTRSGFEDEVLDVFRHGGEPIANARIFGEEVDFYWPRLGVVVEVDGSPHDNPTARADDDAKTRRLQAHGFKVLRLR